MADPATPFNPSVKLPRALQAKVEAGEKLFRENYPDLLRAAAEGGDGPPPPEPPPAPPAEVPPPVDPQEDKGGGGDEAPPPPAPPAKPDELESTKQKLRTLQGKYNHETGELRKQLAEMANIMTQLTGQITLLREAQASKPPPAPEPEPQDPSAENFEPELVAYVDRRIQARTKSLQEQLGAAQLTIASLKAQLGGVEKNQKNQAKNYLDQRLDEAMPGWQVQNEDEAFIRWVNTAIHEPTGIPWKTILDNAAKSQDIARIVMVFRAYPDTTLAQPPASPAPPPNPPRRETERVRLLDTMAVPPRGRQVPIDQPSSGAIITSADLQRFTSDVAKGRYRGDPAAKEAIERAIDKAMAEGRFQQTH